MAHSSNLPSCPVGAAEHDDPVGAAEHDEPRVPIVEVAFKNDMW